MPGGMVTLAGAGIRRNTWSVLGFTAENRLSPDEQHSRPTVQLIQNLTEPADLLAI